MRIFISSSGFVKFKALSIWNFIIIIIIIIIIIEFDVKTHISTVSSN